MGGLCIIMTGCAIGGGAGGAVIMGLFWATIWDIVDWGGLGGAGLGGAGCGGGGGGSAGAIGGR